MWGKQDLDQVELLDTLDSIKAEAGFQELPHLSGDMLREAAHRMRPRAGQGVDKVPPLDVERLPQEGLDELADILTAVESRFT